MDLYKMQDNAKLDLCKFYFKIGFLCLPLLWIVNAIWFFHDAFRRPSFVEQKSLRLYVIFSAVGGLLWVLALSYWMYIYQVERYNWGVTGELISYILPTGEF